ncbi:hypothetical protein D3C72_1015930 [compost metagenome]
MPMPLTISSRRVITASNESKPVRIDSVFSMMLFPVARYFWTEIKVIDRYRKKFTL